MESFKHTFMQNYKTLLVIYPQYIVCVTPDYVYIHT